MVCISARNNADTYVHNHEDECERHQNKVGHTNDDETSPQRFGRLQKVALQHLQQGHTVMFKITNALDRFIALNSAKPTFVRRLNM